MSIQLLKRRFTVEEYRQMTQAGILDEDDRVELIEGEIVEMTPIGSRHAACVDRINRLFTRRLGQSIIVRIQSPIHLNEYTEPQPDLALLMPRPDFYARRHPGPTEVLLVVEVAETSTSSDREVKLPLYARAGIPEAWLVDLTQDRIEVYRRPSASSYREVQRIERGNSLNSQALPDIALRAEDLLG